jgi:UDP-N-acetylmuramate--alanine ligase
MLAELMKFKTSIAISGSHGKTTTTSLVASIFEAAGLHPTVINGGVINNRSTNAYIGKDNYLIAEADESDATFIKIPSTIGVITNIDPEHMDYYSTFDSLVQSFESFITNLPFYGFAVLCIDHPVVRQLANKICNRKIITYGIDSDDANVRAYNIRMDVDHSIYDVQISLPSSRVSVSVENIKLPTAGIHNVLNSLAPISIAAELNFGIKVISRGFEKFTGVKRRFTKTGEYNGVYIIDDYAHHPVEVAATIQAAKSVADKRGGKVVAVFQPHRYTRLSNLFEGFANAFTQADQIYVSEIYSAGESPIEGVSHLSLVKRINEVHKTKNIAIALDNKEDLVDIVKENTKDGDIVLMMGAGSITQWATELPSKLQSLSR